MGKRFVAIAAALLLAAASIELAAQDYDAERPRQLPRRLGPIQQAIAEIDLSTEQLQQIDALMEEYAEKMRKHRDVYRSLRPLIREMQELYRSGDMEAAKAKQREIQELTAPIRELEEEYIEKVKAVMTQEQAAKFEGHISNLRRFGPKGPGVVPGRPGFSPGEGGPGAPEQGVGSARGPRPGGGLAARRPGDIFGQLDLTDEQKEKLRALKKEQEQEHPELKADTARLRTLNRQLRRLQQQTPPDYEKINDTRAEIESLRRNLKESHESFMAEVEKILTDEQKKKLRKILKNFKRREGPGQEIIFEKLNLTDGQKGKISALREELSGKVQEKQQAIEKKQRELRELFEEMRAYHEEFEKEVLEILTPEQQEIFKNFIQERRKRLEEERPGMGKGRPQRRDFIHRPGPPEPQL